MSTPTAEEVQAEWVRCNGNKAKTAANLGCSADTVSRRLKSLGLDGTPLFKTGQTKQVNQKPLPETGKIARYLISSAQSEAPIHKRFWKNLTAYADYLNAEIMIGGYTYNAEAYRKMNEALILNPHLSEEERIKGQYDASIAPYVINTALHEQRGDFGIWELAPGLHIRGEMRVLPTAGRPLSGLASYNGVCSNIICHPKLALESIATSANDPVKFNYTTGSVTPPKYLQMKAGTKAEFHHVLGCLIVEVDEFGRKWVRQINADADGSFFDCPDIGEVGAIEVRNGQIKTGQRAEAVSAGDLHAVEADDDALQSLFGQDLEFDSIIDAIQPNKLFLHDVLSFRAQSHHEQDFMTKMKKRSEGIHLVEDEVKETADVINHAVRDDMEVIIVNSNHDRHGEKWLQDIRNVDDPDNGVYWCLARAAWMQAVIDQEDWEFHHWALTTSGVDKDVRFLKRDESYMICGSIECGTHGDDGPNGSRGTTLNLAHTGRKINKGHDHTAAIVDGVYSAGACARRFGYMHGPSSHSVSHIVVWPNGKRAIITHEAGWWRA